jgi:RNA polymerase sigma factor (sigma-70 family)
LNIEALYHKFKNLVFNLALQYTNNVEDAEEITQDVFLKIYNNFNEFEHKAEIKTWIYRITINQSLDYIRSKKSKKGSFFIHFLETKHNENYSQISDFNHPGILFENKEALMQLMKKINQLPENQKTVIILLKIEDLTQKEVAEIMNLKEGAIESLFQRAKNNLKKIL